MRTSLVLDTLEMALWARDRDGLTVAAGLVHHNDAGNQPGLNRSSQQSVRELNLGITLYTGNTYFRYPQLRWPGTFRPFRDYASHLDLIALYTFNEDSTARIEDLELIVHEPWRIVK